MSDQNDLEQSASCEHVPAKGEQTSNSGNYETESEGEDSGVHTETKPSAEHVGTPKMAADETVVANILANGVAVRSTLVDVPAVQTDHNSDTPTTSMPEAPTIASTVVPQPAATVAASRTPTAPKRFKEAHEVMSCKALEMLRGKVKGTKQCAKDLFISFADRLMQCLISNECLRFTLSDSAVRSAAASLLGLPAGSATPYMAAPEALKSPFETLKREVRRLHTEAHGSSVKVDMPRAGLAQVANDGNYTSY